MKFISDFFSSQWTIAIISPMIVAFVLYSLKNRLSKFSKNKKIDVARNSVVNYLEKLVTNGTNLDDKKMSMIFSYFIRKYNIDKKSMHKTDVLEDLLVRIYSIDYIQLNQREEILSHLESLHTYYNIPSVKKISYNSRVVKNTDNNYFKVYQRKFSNILIIYIYTIIFSISFMLFVFKFKPTSQYEWLHLLMYPFKPEEKTTFITINLFMIGVLFVLSLLLYVYLNVIRISKKTNNKKNK